MFNGVDPEELKVYSRGLVALTKKVMQDANIDEKGRKLLQKLNYVIKEKEIDEEKEIRKFLLLLFPDLQSAWRERGECNVPQCMDYEHDQSFQVLNEAPEFDGKLHGCLHRLMGRYFPYAIPNTGAIQTPSAVLQKHEDKDEILEECDVENSVEGEVNLTEEENYDPEIDRYLNFLEDQLYPKLTNFIYQSGDLEKYGLSNRENGSLQESMSTNEGSCCSAEVEEARSTHSTPEIEEQPADEEASEVEQVEEMSENGDLTSLERDPEFLECVFSLMKKVFPRLTNYTETHLSKYKANNSFKMSNKVGNRDQGIDNVQNDSTEFEQILNEVENFMKCYAEGSFGEQLRLHAQQFYPQLLNLWEADEVGNDRLD